MTQRRDGYYDPEIQDKVDRGVLKSRHQPKRDFIFRGGCTLLVDPNNAEVRYCIQKNIRSESRLERVRRYLTMEETPSLRATYFGDRVKTYYWRFPDEMRTWSNDQPRNLLDSSTVTSG